MSEEAKDVKDDAARADAEAGEKLDKILACVDSLIKRMDSLEDMEKAKKADAEDDKDEAKADKDSKAEAKEDAEEEAKADGDMEDGKMPGEAKEVAADKRKDAEDDKDAKADAQSERIAGLEAALEKISKKIPKQMTDAELNEMSSVQAQADAVFQAFGDSAPRPQTGEDLAGYRRRLVTKLKEHSPAWKDTNVAAIFDANAFATIEKQVYADALSAAQRPADLEPGALREIKTRDTTGREISSFVGEPSAWMAGFTGHRRRLVGISRAN